MSRTVLTYVIILVTIMAISPEAVWAQKDSKNGATDGSRALEELAILINTTNVSIEQLSAGWRLVLAEAHAALGNAEQAFAIAQSVRRESNEMPAGLSRMAVQFAFRGEVKNVRSTLEKIGNSEAAIRRKYQGYRDAAYHFATIGDQKAAREMLNGAERELMHLHDFVNADLVGYWSSRYVRDLALLYLKTGNEVAARRLADRLYNLSNGVTNESLRAGEFLKEAAKIYTRLGDVDTARQIADSIQSSVNRTGIFYGIVQAFLARGEINRAIQVAERTERNFTRARLHLMIAESLVEKGDSDTARKQVQLTERIAIKLAAMNPNASIVFLSDASALHMGTGNRDAAIAALEKARQVGKGAKVKDVFGQLGKTAMAAAHQGLEQSARDIFATMQTMTTREATGLQAIYPGTLLRILYEYQARAGLCKEARRTMNVIQEKDADDWVAGKYIACLVTKDVDEAFATVRSLNDQTHRKLGYGVIIRKAFELEKPHVAIRALNERYGNVGEWPDSGFLRVASELYKKEGLKTALAWAERLPRRGLQTGAQLQMIDTILEKRRGAIPLPE